MAGSVSIKAEHVTAGRRVRISSPQLATHLIQNPKTALRLLSSVGAPVTPDQVSIDSSGKVVVNNPQFATALKTRLRGLSTAANNGVCGVGCARPSAGAPTKVSG
jgi:hypothetical protein